MRKSISVAFFSTVATLMILGVAVMGLSQLVLFSRYFAQERFATLDDVGDLAARTATYVWKGLDEQVHLLRVLQEMQVRRVGGVRSIPVDVRIRSNRARRKARTARSPSASRPSWARWT